jgi:hypothetical protein
MRKLRLNPESLQVESFASTADHAAAGGTVRARESEPTDPNFHSCDYLTCAPPSCYLTCGCTNETCNTAVDPTCVGEPECG